MNDVIIPIKPGSNVTVDWGDGSPLETFTGTGSEGYPANYDTLFYENNHIDLSVQDFVVGDMPHHQYASPGLYDIKLTGVVSGFWPAPILPQSKSTLTDVKQWGSLSINDYASGDPQNYEPGYDNGEVGGLFLGRRFFKMTATDTPTFFPNQNLNGLFAHCRFFNADIASWDVSNVVSMRQMFDSANLFDVDLTTWNVANVSDYEDFASRSPYDAMRDRWPPFVYTAPIDVSYTPLTFIVNPTAQGSGDGGGEYDGEMGPEGGTSGHAVTLNIDMLSNYEPESADKIIVIDWGDGTIEDYRSSTSDNGGIIHTYQSDELHTVKIWGTIPGWGDYGWYSNSEHCVVDITAFGETAIESYNMMFQRRKNFAISAVDSPNFPPNTDFSYGFAECEGFNSNINHWDMSNVVNLSQLFNDTSSFNQPLNNWDVSNVTDFRHMLAWNTLFDQPLDNWNVSSGTDFSGMFQGTQAFNQSLTGWVMSNAERLESMFANTAAFNGNLSGWDVSNVINMSEMFRNAEAFNQDIGGWIVSSCANYDKMFDGALVFNQDLSPWIDHAPLGSKMWGIFRNSPNELVLDHYPQRPTKMKFDLRNKQSANTSLHMGFTNGSYVVDWGDGTVDKNITHDYSEQKEVVVRFVGTYIYFNLPNWEDRDGVLVDVMDWGTLALDLRKFFQNRTGFIISATNGPSFSRFTLEQVFEGCTDFNSDIGHWDVSKIENLRRMFQGAAAFNQDISGWDTSSVLDMTQMLYNATAFNWDLSGWDTTSLDGPGSLSSFATNSGIENEPQKWPQRA